MWTRCVCTVPCAGCGAGGGPSTAGRNVIFVLKGAKAETWKTTTTNNGNQPQTVIAHEFTASPSSKGEITLEAYGGFPHRSQSFVEQQHTRCTFERGCGWFS